MVDIRPLRRGVLKVLSPGAQESGNEHGVRRSALLRMAIYSAACSKVTALALQGLAIPLVYRSLGSHQYAIYVLLSGLLSTISILQMGAGPGLTRELARAHANDEPEREASLCGAALIFSVSAAIAGAGGVILAVRTIPSGVLFGAAFAGDQAETVQIATLCAVLLGVHIVMGIVDSTLAGYQEQVFTGVSTTIGNVVTTVVLYLVCSYRPSIIAVIFVMYGLPVCSRGVNLVLLIRRRPHLLKCFADFCGMPIGMLVKTGAGFWAIQIGSLIEQNAGPFLVAHFSTPQAVGVFAIAFKLVNYSVAAAGVFTQPLWPSLTDAIVRNDVHWMRQTFRNIKMTLLPMSVVLAGGWIALSGWVFRTLFRVSVPPQRMLILLFGIYLVANVWTHVHYVSLMGIGNLWKIAAIIVGENFLMVIAGALFAQRWGAGGVALGYLVASLVLPVWLLPRIMSVTMLNCCPKPLVAGAAS